MYAMRNKTKKNFDTSFLSNSYREGVERVVGLKEPVVFEIPPETIKKRQEYWNKLFLKYSEEVSDDVVLDIETLKPYIDQSEIVHKSKSTIQHWVDTGYLPYQNSARKNNSLSNNLPGIQKEQDTSYIRSYDDESPFSSSVDTAVYILSNINTTNKVETMAIVEGAKHNSSSNLWSATTYIGGTEIIQVANDKICNSNSGSNTENNSSSNHQRHSTTQVDNDKICDSDTENNTNNENNDNHQQYSSILPANDKINDGSAEHNISNNNNNRQSHSPITSEKMTCTSQHQNIDPGKNTDTVHQTVNTDSPSSKENRSYSHMLLNSLTTPVYSEQNCLEKSTLTNNTMKIKPRKKLYTGRDSPVDLVTMKQSSNKMLCRSNQNVHPALDVRYPLQKRLKVHKKRNIRHPCILNKRLMNKFLPNHSKPDEVENSQNYFNQLVLRLNGLKEHDDTIRTNNNDLNASKEITNLNKCNSDQLVDASLSSQCVNENRKRTVKKSVSTKGRYSNKRKRSNAKMYNKFNNTFKRSKSLNPVVRLTKLSEDVLIRSKKKANELMRIHKNLQPVVMLKKLSNFDIQKYKRSRNHSCKSQPVVYLKRLSEFEIQKYKRPTNTMEDDSRLSPETSIKELSEATVEKNTTIHDTETHNKTDLLSKTDQLPANSINSYKLPFRNVSHCSQSLINVINVVSNDTDSDESTVLIYKCSQTSSVSNNSLVSKNTQKSYRSAMEVCSNSNSIMNKRNKNTILRKGVSNKQSAGETLNAFNSQKQFYTSSFDTSRVMDQDRSNNNICINSDEKVKLKIVVCSDTDSESSKRSRRRKKKVNLSKNQNKKAEVRNGIGSTVSARRTMTRNATNALQDVKVKVKKGNSKHTINYLHFETKFYESSSSDSDLPSCSSE